MHYIIRSSRATGLVELSVCDLNRGRITYRFKVSIDAGRKPNRPDALRPRRIRRAAPNEENYRQRLGV